MPKFLTIETSTQACSAAISDNERILAYKEVDEYKAHARLLAPFVQELLDQVGIKLNECDAVSVSEGPGSYTGLRVGVSTAKGLCFGADIPLIGVSTLDVLVRMAMEKSVCAEGVLIVPMIDARRMEVYCASYNHLSVRLSPIEAKVLDADSFSKEFATYNKIIFIGDGALKFKDVLSEDKLAKSEFIECYPLARYMAIPTLEAYNKKEFKDVAYFEPFYLKEFVAGVSKKTLI